MEAKHSSGSVHPISRGYDLRTLRLLRDSGYTHVRANDTWGWEAVEMAIDSASPTLLLAPFSPPLAARDLLPCFTSCSCADCRALPSDVERQEREADLDFDWELQAGRFDGDEEINEPAAIVSWLQWSLGGRAA